MDTNDVAVHPEHDANATILLTATGTTIDEKHISCIIHAKKKDLPKPETFRQHCYAIINA